MRAGSRRSVHSRILLASAWIALAAMPGRAQEAEPQWAFDFDLTGISLGLTFWHRPDQDTDLWFGAGFGAGPCYMLDSSELTTGFSDSDERGNWDLARVNLLLSYRPGDHVHLDLGLRASIMDDVTSSDFSLAGFLGAEAGAMVGWSWLKFGPRVIVGVLDVPLERRDEFLIAVVPLSLRLTANW